MVQTPCGRLVRDATAKNRGATRYPGICEGPFVMAPGGGAFPGRRVPWAARSLGGAFVPWAGAFPGRTYYTVGPTRYFTAQVTIELLCISAHSVFNHSTSFNLALAKPHSRLGQISPAPFKEHATPPARATCVPAPLLNACKSSTANWLPFTTSILGSGNAHTRLRERAPYTWREERRGH